MEMRDMMALRSGFRAFGLSDGQQQRARWDVNRHGERLVEGDPAKFAGFLVQFYDRLADAAASIVQQDEMGLAIKLFGMNAILHEDELDVSDIQGGLLFEFTP